MFLSTFSSCKLISSVLQEHSNLDFPYIIILYITLQDSAMLPLILGCFKIIYSFCHNLAALKLSKVRFQRVYRTYDPFSSIFPSVYCMYILYIPTNTHSQKICLHVSGHYGNPAPLGHSSTYPVTTPLLGL